LSEKKNALSYLKLYDEAQLYNFEEWTVNLASDEISDDFSPPSIFPIQKFSFDR